MLLLDLVWERSFSLSLAFCIGLWSVIFIGPIREPNVEPPQLTRSHEGTGFAYDAAPRSDIKPGDAAEVTSVPGSSSLKVIAKPRAQYTDEARSNQVQGTVILRVVFLASGAIGTVSTVKGLPNGLTEQAVAAARYIKFEPARKDGKPITVSKQVEYTFSIY